jgi:hypothetical protein
MQEVFKKVPRNALLLLLVALSAMMAQAQLGGGLITGSIHDSNGAVLPGATVIVREISTGQSYSFTSNSDGSFQTPTLRVGTYTVSASAQGFSTAEQTGVVLLVDARAQVEFTLHPGNVNETVQVSAAAPSLNLTTPTVGMVIENRSIEQLPLNGRNAAALVFLTPGVNTNGGANYEGFADRGTLLTSISINNGPNAANAILLDGANNIQTYLGEISINPAVDAIQEFKVQTGTMPAEYGFTAGGIVNMVTRSGTNAFHGTVYEFLRNDVFDGRNYFLSPTSRKPELRYNQYGGAVGGPIIHNKAFFFGNYEEFRYISSAVNIGSVPTARERNGDFSDLFGTNGQPIPIYNPTTTSPNPGGSGYIRSLYPGNVIDTPLDPVALAIQDAIVPLPNRTPTNVLTNANNYSAVVPNHRSMRQATGRIDYGLSNRQNIFLRYSYYNFFNDNGGNGGIFTAPAVELRNDNLTNQSAILADTYTFSGTLQNEFRLAANRTDFPFVVSSYGGNWPQKLGFPAIVPNTVFPTISGWGLPSGLTGTVGHRAATNPQLIDTVSLQRGNHVFRFGVDWRLNRGYNYQTTNPSGNFSFSSLLTGNPQSQSGTGSAYASFLLGAVASSTVGTYTGESEANYTVSGYVEDDWKVISNFTLNLGLRYDYQQQPVEQHNGLSNFNPYIEDPVSGLLGATQFAGVNGAPRNFRNEDYSDFGPRIGFAWDVFRDGKTSLRGGYGIYYELGFNTIFFGNTNGFAQTNTNYQSPGNNPNFPAYQLSLGFPSQPIQPLGASLGPSGFLGQSVSYDPPQGKMPMSQQMNLSIQHELPSDTVIEIGYVGNHGTHMVGGNWNLNQLNPQYLSLGDQLQNQVPNPYAGKVHGSLGGPTISRQQSLLPYPYYQAIMVRNPRDGFFHGDSLQVSAVRHATQGLTLIAAYTYSHMLSNPLQTNLNFGGVTSNANVGIYSNGAYQNSYNRNAEYSTDPLDVTHRATISALYDLPFGHGKQFGSQVNSVLDEIIGGWQVNTIAIMQTGNPLVISGANNNAAARPNMIPGVSVKSPHQSIAEWFNTRAFINPPNYTYGNAPRTISQARAPGLVNLDLSMFKTFPIYESMNLQFRAESFNVLNHPNFGLPNTTFVPGANGLNSSGSFGTVTQAYNARSIQFGLKLSF